MFLSGWGRRGALACLLLAVLLWSCRRENPSNFDRNFAPETYVSGAPAESALAYYQVHLYWHGNDRDGRVDYYEYSVTDSNKTPGEDTPDFSGYYRTASTDSVFRLVADDPQILGHRFYVRAVDNEGKADPTPAWTYFVAHDYSFPAVHFMRGIGTWTDKAGNPRSVSLKSSDRFVPKDTIGVGGCVEVSWTGSDADVGGMVVGYEYRLSTDTDFRGGGLADTSIAVCYPDIFSAKPTTGRDAIFVRAIDDAGARTLPDSVRAYVVNFDPVTQIVHPENPQPTPARIFKDELGRLWPSRTYLADSQEGRSIQFNFVGFDDPRDQKRNPDDVGVIGFSYRRLENGGGPSYRPIIPWSEYPAINAFAGAPTTNLRSGEWTFLIRATDELGRSGKPDTVVVNVNYPPYVTGVKYVDQAGELQDLWDPFTGGIVTIHHPLNGGAPPPLQVVIDGSDVHSPEDPSPYETVPVVEDEIGIVEEYKVRINGSPDGFIPYPPGEGIRTFSVSADTSATGVVRPGCQNSLEVTLKDNSDRTSLIIVRFCVDFD